MSTGLDFQDPRLNAVVGPLESGNYKKALQEVNKLLKKTPSCATAKVLKAIVLNRSGKAIEGDVLAEEVINECPTDEATITAIMCYLRKTGQIQRISEYLKNALIKCPNREDLLVYLFLHQVQEQDYFSQQATARLLSQHYPKGPYAFWMIVSTLMQGISDPVMGERMFFPLAERLLLREIDNGKVTKHNELKLLIDLLLRLKKYEDALKLFDRKELIGFLDSGDYTYDYSREILELNIHLKSWDECFHLASTNLKKDPDDWLLWKSLIEMVIVPSNDECMMRTEKLSSLIADLIKSHPHLRGPQLARLDLCAVLNKADLEGLPIQQRQWSYIKEYFDNFSPKPICALDLAYVLPQVLTEQTDLDRFINSTVDECEPSGDTVNPDDKTINRHACAYQIARANNYPLSLEKLLQLYFLYAPQRKLMSEMTDDQNTSLNSSDVSDPYPVDSFLLLALSNLMEQTCSSNKLDSSSTMLGRSLVAAHWIKSAGLAYSPFNHHLRLKLCRLFSPMSLNCVDLILPQLNQLDIKRLLLISLGYLSVSSTPTLALWGESQSAGQQQQQQTENPTSVLGHYQFVRSLWDAMIAETEEFLVVAYRRNTYTKIQEFTSFLNSIRHADVFVTASLELLHWQLVTSVNDFDVLLEHLGATETEFSMVLSRLNHLTDCRDLAVTPEFNPIPSQEQEFAQASWKDLKHWLALRSTVLSILQLNTKLVMRIVCAEDKLIIKPNLPESIDLTTSKQDPDVTTKLNEKLDIVQNLLDQYPLTQDKSVLSLDNLASDLVTKPQNLFVSPVSTPTTSAVSLYLYGPYNAIISLGTKLLIGIHDMLTNGQASSFTQETEQSILTDLKNVFTTSSTTRSNPCSKHLIQLNWVEIPSPSGSDHLTNPAGLLSIVAYLYECISLVNILLSMVRSALRPRSHFHSQLSKKTKRKAAKSGKHGPAENGPDEPTELDQNAVLFARLDQLGYRLSKLVLTMTQMTESLAGRVNDWLKWSTHDAKTDLINLASDVCADALPTAFLDENPVLKPTSSSPIFGDIASSYSNCFGRIVSGLRAKADNFKHMTSELGVYECIGKLSQCTIQQHSPTSETRTA